MLLEDAATYKQNNCSYSTALIVLSLKPATCVTLGENLESKQFLPKWPWDWPWIKSYSEQLFCL